MVSGGFMQSPGTAAWAIFWLYTVLMAGGLYTLFQIFKEKHIVYGHFDDLFRFLTRLRIWSIRHRKTYIGIVSAVLGLIFLTLVYWSERLHALLFGAETVFAGLPDYLLWISVFVVSGLQVGEYPNSLLAFVLSGVFPLFVLGSALTIVRITSESAHDVLIDQMARGDIAPYRIVVFNYREKYDEFVRSLLTQSDAFVLIFAKEDHLQDAESFVEGVSETDTREYRMSVESLSYSEDVLFEEYNLLRSNELYVFPDTESQTDYENLRLITRLNRTAKRRASNEQDRSAPPNTVWLADSRKLSGVVDALESTPFKRRLHAFSFQTDVRDLVRINTGDSLREMDEYFNFADAETAPDWVTGYELSNYTFDTNPLTDDELADLDEIGAFRERGTERIDHGDQSALASFKQETLFGVGERLRRELEGQPPERIGPFYGLLAQAAEATVPLDFSSAYLNQQIETATDAIQIRKDDDATHGHAADSGGDVFIVNYNASIEAYVRSFGERESDTDRHLTVYHSANQVTPETDGNVNYAEYDSKMQLLEMLMNQTERSPRRVKPGDTVLLMLDNTIPNPEVNVLQILDAIDDKLEADTVDLDHNDLFLAIESDLGTSNEEYRYLAVDKAVETHRTQKLFLHNLVQFRTSDVVQGLLQEGKLTPREAFDLAAEASYYFREYRLDDAARIHDTDRAVASAVDTEIGTMVETWRELDQRDELPFTTFSIHRSDDHGLRIELDELTRDLRIEEGQFLLSLPQV